MRRLALFSTLAVFLLSSSTVHAASTHHYSCSDTFASFSSPASCSADIWTFAGNESIVDQNVNYSATQGSTYYVSFTYSGSGSMCYGVGDGNASSGTANTSGTVTAASLVKSGAGNAVFLDNRTSGGMFCSGQSFVGTIADLCITDTSGDCEATSTPTVNRLAKFVTATTLGDSLFSDDGSNTTLTAGNLFVQIGSLIDTITNGTLNFGTTNATTMTFGRSGQNMIINSKVGIATSTPTAALHVNGDLFANVIALAANGLGLDTLTSGTLSIGSTTASAITIGRTGATTTIPTLLIGKAGTSSNCSSSTSPAVCGSAPSGSVAMPTGGSTVVVNTSAVTASSQILVTEDSSLGTRLGITCNTATGRNYSINARAAGTSFTIKSSANPATNKACLSYWIIN